MAYPVVEVLDYEIVADIVDSVDDLVAALDDDKVDYYCIDWGLDLDVVVDFDVFHLQVQTKRLQPGEEEEPYHLMKMDIGLYITVSTLLPAHYLC